ncbi:hypothetical protein HDU76_006161, partial [Blyttiomyces sp. JEL0837]
MPVDMDNPEPRTLNIGEDSSNDDNLQATANNDPIHDQLNTTNPTSPSSQGSPTSTPGLLSGSTSSLTTVVSIDMINPTITTSTSSTTIHHPLELSEGNENDHIDHVDSIDNHGGKVTVEESHIHEDGTGTDVGACIHKVDGDHEEINESREVNQLFGVSTEGQEDHTELNDDDIPISLTMTMNQVYVDALRRLNQFPSMGSLGATATGTTSGSTLLEQQLDHQSTTFQIPLPQPLPPALPPPPPLPTFGNATQNQVHPHPHPIGILQNANNQQPNNNNNIRPTNQNPHHNQQRRKSTLDIYTPIFLTLFHILTTIISPITLLILRNAPCGFTDDISSTGSYSPFSESLLVHSASVVGGGGGSATAVASIITSTITTTTTPTSFTSFNGGGVGNRGESYFLKPIGHNNNNDNTGNGYLSLNGSTANSGNPDALKWFMGIMAVVVFIDFIRFGLRCSIGYLDRRIGDNGGGGDDVVLRRRVRTVRMATNMLRPLW